MSSQAPTPSRPLSVVIAGGGTAGHIEPALAVADAVRAADPNIRITALGTTKGLETALVPQRGYDLRLIPPVPVPRRVTKQLFALPLTVLTAVRATRAILDEVAADVVIGFGGYVAAPAYLAARLGGRRIPTLVHEANARAGMANKLGVALGGLGLAAVADSGLRAEVVGIPVRAALSQLDRAGLRATAREHFGLAQDQPVLLVTGGSQGARSINAAVSAAAGEFAAAGVQVLHAFGQKNEVVVPPQLPGAPAYIGLPYIERMDLALSAADMVLCRSGALTVAEISAVGLPAAYVPLPHGNGEQALNAAGVIAAGGGLLIPDADLDVASIRAEVLPIITDPQRCAAMGEAAAGAGSRDAATAIAGRILALAPHR